MRGLFCGDFQILDDFAQCNPQGKLLKLSLMTTSANPQAPQSGKPEYTALYWMWLGAKQAISLPALMLGGAFVGFAAVARDMGFSLTEIIFMTAFVWALPAQIVLIGALASGMSLPAAALAVSLSSVRLMPMVVAITPEMRTQETRPWVLYFLSHFVAVTSWVIAMEQFGGIPRRQRTAFYFGLAFMLLVAMLLVLAIVYLTAAVLPPMLGAGLVFLMPAYFLFSLWGSARESASHIAMIAGLVLGPLLHPVLPGFDLLVAGIIAGIGAFLIHGLKQRTTGGS